MSAPEASGSSAVTNPTIVPGDTTVSADHALIPLTVFDKVFERTTFVTGWLVEGKVDARVLESALHRLTDKWRLLAGRLQSHKEGTNTKWFVKVPLGPLPPPSDYPTFTLTTTTSDDPITHHVPIPIPQVCPSLPPELFVGATTPRQYTAWEATQHPLTAWHLTYFPARSNEPMSALAEKDDVPTDDALTPRFQAAAKTYTTIGFARSHGIFDGVGASFIVRALVAEMKGEPWTVPPLPQAGIVYVNPVQQVLEQKYLTCDRMYRGYTALGYTGFAKIVAWHVRETWWRGATRQICLLPKEAFEFLVEGVREGVRRDGKDPRSVSSGDVLVAWIYKTIYSKGISPDTMVHITNVASFRSLLSTSDAIATYPHNAFLPLPYPVLSVSDVQSFSLPALTSILTTSRLSLSKPQVVAAFKMLSSGGHFPSHPEAQDNLTVSNVSASRILEADWSATGVGRTVCGYRYQLTPTGVVFANAIYIAGRLDDGTVVLDVTLNTLKLKLLVDAVTALIDEAADAKRKGQTS